ncbi:ABC-type Co2+ transport system, permease component [Hyella patelloides LEGE 07179]|uniref:ABC-type Co2+ transport system, permease component n=1 Tax=Hyella patelloides LEGE 07179 TaxID=945734 RepID=A0A563VQ52_9CYAN|nr:cobalt transporter CbiM [Hyella patelloides]VEP13598.1 ABC-type Co2+ transport system, permease component [Hyella patelloides LEGE 07179]
MHIPDGFVPPSICLAGYAISGGVTWYSLREIQRDRDPQSSIPKSALFTAVFFIASLIHIPAPPPLTSFHLVLNGMMGTLLGYYAFLAIPIGLFFQAVMFQHGGMSTLGINAVIMGLPAIVAYYVFRLRSHLPRKQQFWTKALAFISGASAVLLSATLFAAIAIGTISPELNAATERTAIYLSLGSYLIQALVEGTFTVMIVSFLEKVKPELLQV